MVRHAGVLYPDPDPRVAAAHVWSTAWRVYADRGEFRRRPVLHFAIPAAAYAAGVLLFTAGRAVFWHATLPKRFHWLLAGDYLAGIPAFTGPAALAAFGVVFALWFAKEVPRLALPQATHYLLDAWIWKVRPENVTASEAVGLATVEPSNGSAAG